ncbi:uroporphyrinogen-III synthase [Shimia litoralis]|nr:uroporphyrinogen-III synthase [Shimia litoralis]
MTKTLPDPTILLTRPLGASLAFRDSLRDAGILSPVEISPVLSITSMLSEPPTKMSGAIFTSKNGVQFAEPQDLPCWCVGDSTAQVASQRGWQAVSASGDAEALIKRILADAPAGPLVHFRGEHARGDIAARLTAQGVPTQETEVYRQSPLPLTQNAIEILNGNIPVVLPLFSPRSARLIAKLGPFLAPVHAVAISADTAQGVDALSLKTCDIAGAPDAKSMIATIRQTLDAACRIVTDEDTP